MPFFCLFAFFGGGEKNHCKTYLLNINEYRKYTAFLEFILRETDLSQSLNREAHNYKFIYVP